MWLRDTDSLHQMVKLNIISDISILTSIYARGLSNSPMLNWKPNDMKVINQKIFGLVTCELVISYKLICSHHHMLVEVCLKYPSIYSTFLIGFHVDYKNVRCTRIKSRGRWASSLWSINWHRSWDQKQKSSFELQFNNNSNIKS